MNPTDDRSAQAIALRRKAMAIVQTQAMESPADLGALSPAETLQMLRELQVHQIELELQNEELRRIQEELETTKARYLDLYEMAPVGYCFLNEEGIILEANLAVTTLLGISRGELVNQPLSRFVCSDDQDILYLLRKTLSANGGTQGCELRMVLSCGTIFWARLDAVRVTGVESAPQCHMAISDISRYKQQSKEALCTSGEQLRLLVQNSPDSLVIVNPDGTQRYIRPAAEKITGFPRDDLEGRAIAPLIHPDDLDTVRAAWAEAISRVTVDSSHLLLDGPGGKPEIYGLDIDLTARKQMEIALRERQAYLQSIFRASPIGIGVVIDRMFSDVNTLLCTITGYSEGELLGQNARMLYPTEAEYRWVGEEKYRQISRSGTGSVETRWQCKDGRIIDVLLSSTPIDSTNLSRGVTFTALDITERKQAEIRIQEQAAFNRRILDSTAAYIAILDPQGMIIDVNTPWNRFAQENAGTQTDKLGPGTSYFCTWGAQYGDITGAEQAFAGIRQVQCGERDSFEIEYSCHSPEEKRWFSLRVLPLAGGEGQVLVFHTDVSALKRTEEHLRAALAEKEVLLREVHHRVKNNLAAIISLLDMQRRMLEDPQSQGILTELAGRIHSMSLIHEKLYHADDLARIDFQQYLKALISHLRTSYGSPRIQYQTEVQGVELALDLAVPCGMIVNELMTNALKYAFPGGQPAADSDACRIRVRMRQENGLCTLSVADNGVGLPPDFDWTKATTLGMVLVRMLGQHQLGGSYTIDQNNGLGVTLTFSEKRGKQ